MEDKTKKNGTAKVGKFTDDKKSELKALELNRARTPEEQARYNELLKFSPQPAK